MAAEAVNVGKAERIGSALGGAVLVMRAMVRPTFGRIGLALGGVALLQRGLTGHCALYERLGLDTAEKPPAPPRRRRHDPVLTASEDSFPASDPPSWTPVAGAVAER